MVEVRRMFYRTYRRPAALTIEPGFWRAFTPGGRAAFGLETLQPSGRSSR